ncbi:MAG: sensor histidine kinase [Paludibacter sp.]|nr:sensor histidine kinase [Paludibacter sp.]
MHIFRIFILLLIISVSQSCQPPKPTEPDVFNSNFARLRSLNNAGFDSLLVFYRQLDSLNLLSPDKGLDYLIKSTEGRMNFRQGNYPQAIECFRSTVQMTTIDSLKALSYMSVGLGYMQMAAFDSAFYYLGKSASAYEQTGNTRMWHVAKSNIAQAYYNKREPEKSKEIISEILAQKPEHSVKLNLLHLKANILGSSGLIDSALLLDRQVIAEYANSGENYLLSSFYNNMGMCFLEKGMPDSALFYCNKSYQTDSVQGMRMNMAANLMLMGDIHKMLSHKNEADKFYMKALEIFRTDGNLDKQYWILESLEASARKDNKLEYALQLQDSMKVLSQKINSKQMNESIELLNIRFETEKKDRLLGYQENYIRSQKAIVFLLLMFLVVALLSLYLYIKNRRRQLILIQAEHDRKLSEMLVEAEQNERERIARDLHDSVCQKLAVIQMQMSMIETPQQDKLNEIADLLKTSASDVRNISHNLFPRDLEKGIVAALTHLCEQNNYLNKNLKFEFKPDAAFANHSFPRNIELVIYRVVQELTNNAIKYSRASRITISLGFRQRTVLLAVEDDGVGFDTNKIGENSGIGLKNIFERIRRISGKVSVVSKESGGTHFNIEIPV